MSDYENADSLERPEDLEKDQAGIVRRWLLEIKLADKRDGEWRKKADKVWERYRQEKAKKNSFNILWSNTETLRQAVYNSVPRPDVRRRFKDADPVGKQVSTILSRAIEYGLDTTDFDHDVQSVVLDMLLPGRGVARVRYVPDLAQVGVTPETHEEENEVHEEGGEALEGDSEEVAWEQAPIEHVQWDDFRILSAGKCWSEVNAIGFRHRMTRDELEEKFGEEIGCAVKLDSTDEDELQKERDEHLAKSFQTAEVWEIWDKDEREVLFISSGYKDAPLDVIDDPLTLQGFFPIPRPFYAIEDSSSLNPIPLYELYKEQAEELDRISSRINKLIAGLKMRGIYDSTLTELSELMKGEDNELIPAQSVTALLERGGLDKAIWFMPIEQSAKVLQALYTQRDQCKQVIYELTGISDIMRSASDPNETFGAQKIKTQWGTQRLQRMQKEAQRFICDLIRLQAEIIAEKFSPETLATMTGVKLPHQAEVDQQYEMQLQQWQMQAQQVAQTGQSTPPQPQPPQVITWEAVMQVMRDDKQRTFKIDVETDSTIAATQDSDMEGMTQVLTAVVKVAEGFAPAVQNGAMPIEAVKEIIMTVCRRAKMGNAVEDALDKMTAPKPQADPEAGKMQAQKELEQFKAQLADQQAQKELQYEERHSQLQAQVEAQKQESQAQQNAHQNALESERAQQQAALDARLEQMRIASDERIAAMQQGFDRWKEELQAAVKIEVANIGSKAKLQDAATDTSTGEVAREVN